MRILLVSEAAGGGVARHLDDLAAGLSIDGDSIATAYGPARADTGLVHRLAKIGPAIPIPMTRAPGWRDVSAARRLDALMREHGPFDVIHAHSSKAGGLCRLIPARGAARVYTPHALRTLDPTLDPVRRGLYAQVEGWLARARTDALIAVSQAERDHAAALGAPERILYTIPNGLTPAALRSREESRTVLDISNESFAVGFVGRLATQKAPDRAVAAFAALPENARLIMLGDGPELADLETRIAALGLTPRVIIRSGLDARPIMPAFDVLLAPSRYDGLAYALLEAADAGIPIVATEVPGVREVVEDGVTGFVTPNVNDPEPLVRALRRLLAETDQRNSMGAAGKAKSERFNIRRMVDETRAVYRAACAHRDARSATNK